MRTSKLVIRVVMTALTLLAVSAVGSPQAQAGTYAMRICNVPGQPGGVMGRWESAPAPGLVAVDACSAGEGFSFSFPGVRALTNLPASTFILRWPIEPASRAIKLRHLRAWIVARLDTTTSDMLSMSVTASAGGGGVQNFAYVRAADSTGQLRQYEGVVPSGLPVGVDELQIRLECGVSDRSQSQVRAAQICYPTADTPIDVRGLELTLSEEAAPSATFEGGTLLNAGQQQSGIRTVRYSAQDVESGVARVELLNGEVVIAASDGRSQCPYSDFAACPTSVSGEFSIDTKSITNGARQLMLRVTDAAGNQKLVPTPAVHITARGKYVGHSAYETCGALK